MKDSLHILKSIPMLALVFGALTLAGCDDDSSVTDPGTTGETTISGRVTDDAGFSKAADVEDADVRAAEVDDEGNRDQADGEAVTSADGRYSLETEADSRVMIVTATKADFTSETLVVNRDDDDTIAAMDMNDETRAEAGVYVEARSMDGNERPVTAGDVALYVDAETAASIRANNTSDAEVASAVHSAVEGELMYLSEANVSSDDIDAATDNKVDAFVALQSNISAGGDAANAMNEFTSSMADAHVDAGIDATLSAEARQTASLVLANLVNDLNATAQFALRQRAELLAALTTAAAVEAEFRSESNLESEADAVENAGITLATSIAAASSESDIEDAWAAFESETKAQLSAGITLGAALLETVEASLLSLKTSFDDSIAAASSIDAVIELKSEYHADARAQAETDLSTISNAEFAARVLTLVSAH